MNDSKPPAIRLTSFSHGGGCGCKVAPGLLSEILQRSASPFPIPAALLVGIETSDDAAVYRINSDQAVVATTDFFTPMVDDPFDFGRIAATNAISDVYAMGGTPIFALALVGMPIDRLPKEAIARILEGGEAVCALAGIPIAGGHTIDTPEPLYGLVVLGLIAPHEIKRNDQSRPGDCLVLGKPLGVGIMSAAIKRDQLSPQAYAALIAQTTQLNTPGRALAKLSGVHALTDVTGFGLLGHLLEMCRGAKVSAQIECATMPVLDGALALARAGCITGASRRNWESYQQYVQYPADLAPEWRALLTDPQTSGGLLAACAPDCVAEVLRLFQVEGFGHATVIGRVGEGPVGIRVR
jgi:selenide,water dikinase